MGNAGIIFLLFLILFPLKTHAIWPFDSGDSEPQFDAPYYVLEKKNKAKWAAQDKQINEKLAALEKKFGKKPNIIYILSDDVGWGELGAYFMGKLRGTPTPNLDKMASEGMKFLQGYAEPSCTPTRVAIMTGRQPPRTGHTNVTWPGQDAGLSAEEKTIAEVLSEAGYHTAMWGKWHLGDLIEHAPENQGFDYAFYGQYNGAPFAWPDMQPFYEGAIVPGAGWFFDFPGVEAYKEQYGITLEGIYEARKGQARKEVAKISSAEMPKFEAESANQIVGFIKEKAQTDKPFFIYWATYTNQIAGSPKEYRFKKYVDSRNNQAAQMAQHDESVKRILDTLRELKIAENTLVVWVSDNGPMYAFWPNSGYTWLRGSKGDVYEGGVRVPFFAWWPGMIQPGQDPLDLIHITDLYTTAARLAGALSKIPRDRVTDGVDQTALFLSGEGNGRRNWIFYYSGEELGAIRLNEFKLVLTGKSHGGLPSMEAYNIMRDPGEKFGKFYNYLFLIAPFEHLVKSHFATIKKFPHRVTNPHQEATPEGPQLNPKEH